MQSRHKKAFSKDGWARTFSMFAEHANSLGKPSIKLMMWGMAVLLVNRSWNQEHVSGHDLLGSISEWVENEWLCFICTTAPTFYFPRKSPWALKIKVELTLQRILSDTVPLLNGNTLNHPFCKIQISLEFFAKCCLRPFLPCESQRDVHNWVRGVSRL